MKCIYAAKMAYIVFKLKCRVNSESKLATLRLKLLNTRRVQQIVLSLEMSKMFLLPIKLN